MGAYNNTDRAILGLCADVSIKKIESWAAQADIDFGSPVFSYTGEDTKLYAYVNDVAKIVFDADFEASNSIVITVDGDAWDAVAFDTDHDTTMDALITEGSGEGYEVALDADDTDNRTLYIKKATAGVAVGTVTEAVTGGSGQPDGTITYLSDQVFLGVAMFTQKDVDSTSGGYFEDQAVNVMTVGKIWSAIVDETISANTIAYIQTSGTSVGKFSASGTAVNALFRSDKVTNASTSDVMAMVELEGPKKLNDTIAWV